MHFWVCQSGKAFTAKGMHVLELVGRETMDLLATETCIDIEKDDRETEKDGCEERFSEEATFYRCFWIYGGPEKLEVRCFLRFLLFNRLSSVI